MLFIFWPHNKPQKWFLVVVLFCVRWWSCAWLCKEVRILEIQAAARVHRYGYWTPPISPVCSTETTILGGLFILPLLRRQLPPPPPLRRRQLPVLARKHNGIIIPDTIICTGTTYHERATLNQGKEFGQFVIILTDLIPFSGHLLSK